MTNRQAKLCKEIIRYKKLDEVLRRNKGIDYLDLQDILGPGNLDFSDSSMDENTEVALSEELRGQYEQHQRSNFSEIRAWITLAIAIAAFGLSVFNTIFELLFLV